MSNYYTCFCTGIKADFDDASWCEQYLEFFHTFGDLDTDDACYEKAEKEYKRLDALYGLEEAGCSQPEFEWEYDEDNKLFTLSASDNGSPDHAATFFQEYLKARHPDKCHAFCWSNSSSGMEHQGFGGGAAFITAGSIEWNDAFIWAEDQVKEFEKSK